MYIRKIIYVIITLQFVFYAGIGTRVLPAMLLLFFKLSSEISTQIMTGNIMVFI